MKKKVEAELISLAHKILQLKDTTTLPELQEYARQLYENLAILNFAEHHFEGPQPTIGKVRSSIESRITEMVEHKEEEIIVTPKTNEIEHDESTKTLASEPVEQPTLPLETVVEISKENLKAEVKEQKPSIIIEEINARVSEDLFVPITETNEVNNEDEKPKSINDELKKGIHIGLNDRLAFIKYLFDGSATDYNRVLSQLNTLHHKHEAEAFVSTMVKPDYNAWQGKEEYETRFMELILHKYED